MVRRCYNSTMLNLHSPAGAIYVLQALVSAFLAILFLQSGIDKVIDRRGNLEYLKKHFANSPLAGTVTPMVTVITIAELTAGALSAIGCLLVIFTNNPVVAFYGAVVAGVTLTALFLGQRVAKDYVGAAVLVPYFLLALTAIFVLAEL